MLHIKLLKAAMLSTPAWGFVAKSSHHAGVRAARMNPLKGKSLCDIGQYREIAKYIEIYKNYQNSWIFGSWEVPNRLKMTLLGIAFTTQSMGSETLMATQFMVIFVPIHVISHMGFGSS